MPTVIHPHHSSHHFGVQRTAPQKICIGMGVFFIVIGLLGVMMPGILGMHLSMAHNFIHLASGALALWAGYSENNNHAFNFCLGFGFVYALLGVVGFLMGEPGYPAMGNMEADQYLFRVIPNVLELGTADHIVHLLLGAFFLFSAYVWRKDRRGPKTQRSLKSNLNRPVHGDLDALNRRSTLGSSDIDPHTDVERKI